MASSADIDDAKHGFSRPEMYKDNLAGTVDAYDRHVFLCYKNHSSWPPRVEACDADPLPKRVATAWRARKNDIAVKTKITVCEAREEAGFSDGDVLIFPEMIKYSGLEESNVDSFFDDVMVSGKAWGGKVQDVLVGSHIFVCAHGSRDVRCGVCGPVLIEKLNEEIQLRELKDQISVMACSHVGGHKYAGNLIIYSPGPDGKIMGHWYGYVTPNDVPALLDQHIAKGEVIQKLWRGQMGPPVAEVKGADNQKLANGDDTSKAKKNEVESNNLSNNENVAGCCQDVNGVSCCRSASFEQNKGIYNTAEAHKKQRSKINWSWPLLQERNVLTAAGILGDLAAVAVAYRFYRRVVLKSSTYYSPAALGYINASFISQILPRDIEIIIFYHNLKNEEIEDALHLFAKLPVKNAISFTALIVGPMLSKATKGASEVLNSFEDAEFTFEYKYNGERAQIHYMENGLVEIYSRNAERNTGKLPDVVV